ncbi:MAG TPA: hypothetical protein VNK70_03310 [Candidatus Paceibacterota bacterium]|nr:hypothetical protein [Candidatus Paceibacterota bacterium]
METQIGPSGPYQSEVKTPQEPPKKSRKKFWVVVGAFLAIIVLLFGYIFWQAFDLWLGQRRVERTAEMWRQAEEKLYQMQLADTYGGKTPQETLRMYIEAVEKGDYELASKYFVIEGQEKELNSLKNSPPENTKNVLDFLKISLISEGSFSDDGNGFVIRKPLLVDFVRYPNGIWKIIEI